MKKVFWSLMLAGYILSFNVMALAQVASPSASVMASPSGTPLGGAIQQSPGQLFDLILQDVVAGKFAMAAGGLVLILVYLFRQFVMPKLQLGSGVLPYVSIGLGVIIAVASSLVGGLPAAEAVKIALLSGPIASQLWSSILKLVLHKDA